MIMVIKERLQATVLKQVCDKYFKTYVKFVADLRKDIIAVGGELHSDAETILLQRGSMQSDLWGGNFYPFKPRGNRIEYTSFINIRPRDGNTAMEVQNPQIRDRIKDLVERLLLSPDETLA